MITNKEKSRVCVIAASIFSVVGYVLYFWKNLSGDAHPNVSSWTVFAFVGALSATSYKKVTGDWVKNFFPILNTVLLVIVSLLIIGKGSFRALTAAEWACLFAGASASFYWWTFRKEEKTPAVVQVILEAGMAVAFIPTFLSVAHGQPKDWWLPWFCWDMSFFLQFLVVKFDWGGKYIDFLFPLNRTVLNAVVFILAMS